LLLIRNEIFGALFSPVQVPSPYKSTAQGHYHQLGLALHPNLSFRPYDVPAMSEKAHFPPFEPFVFFLTAHFRPFEPLGIQLNLRSFDILLRYAHT